MDKPKTLISKSLDTNKHRLQELFSVPYNFDFVIRDFEVCFEDGSLPAILVFYDGLVNQTYLNRDIMRGLLQPSGKLPDSSVIEETLYKKIITLAPLTKETDMESTVEKLTFGHCAVFIEGCTCCFAADVKGLSLIHI